MLLLKKGGFADSVEINKTTEKDAKVYFFHDKDDLQSIVELTNSGATDVEGWRTLKH